MDNYTKKVNQQEEESFFSIKDFITACLRNWKWFICSLILFLLFGYFYVAKQEPVYNRMLAVLIKNQDGGSLGDPNNTFSNVGLFQNKADVNNELYSIKSPYVMSEVVNRLKLNINYVRKGSLHPTTLYGSSNPIEVTFPDLSDEQSAGFKAELNPNGTVKLYDFWKHEGGKKLVFDKELNTRLSFNLVKTPIGRITVQPNGAYAGQVSKPEEVVITKNGMLNTIESYTSKVKGDIAKKEADVIELNMNDVCPERACDVLDMMITVYNENWVKDKNVVAVATSEFITERLNVIEAELGNVDNDITAFKTAQNVPDIQMTMSRSMEAEGMIDQALIGERNRLAMVNYIKDYVLNPKNTDKVIPLVSAQDLNLAIGGQIENYNTLLLQCQALRENSGADNPLVRSMEMQVKGARESILGALNSAVGTIEASIKNHESNRTGLHSEVTKTPGQARYLLSVERQQKVKEELYLYLLEKREENELSQAFSAYNTRILTPPWGSQTPVAPRSALIMMVCAFLGLAVPGLVIYLIEATNNKIRSRKDLESLALPFVGEIPFIGKRDSFSKLLKSSSRKREDIDQLKSVVKEGERDIANEAFRVVRSNLSFMLGNSGSCKTIAVTSFNPGSGKSFITYNLGQSLVLKGKRVLLIDGDLRHGSLSQYVGMPKHGTSAYLSGHTDNWEGLVIKNANGSGMDVLPIGHRPPNPAELLENGRIKQLLDTLREHYDIILIDCPPVNIVVDTNIIGEYADRMIFVVRAGLLELSAVPELEVLNKSNKFKNMSILLNGTKHVHSSYYYYGTYHYHSAD